jgi:hypothetical protein
MKGLRTRTLTVLLIAVAMLIASAAVVYAHGQGNGPKGHHGAKRHHNGHHGRSHGFPPNVNHVDLSGYVIDAKYTLGANTGNTFRQTYTATTVQGVPIEGPNVGKTFPPANYVALAIGHKQIYIAWLDDNNAIVDAFVMNFKTGVVFDYAPHAGPESSGTVRIVTKGANRLP